jgi:hypothetical protein
VSDGAGARTAAEELDAGGPALDRALAALSYGARDAALAVFANRTPPEHLKRLVPHIAPRPVHGPLTQNARGTNRAAGARRVKC